MMHHQKLVKSVLNKHKKRDSWFLDDYSVNAYEGCSCNCLYCYVRGSKYSENMDEGLAIKTNSLTILEKQLQLRAKKNEYGFVAVGSATDAYIKQEADYKLTEGFLKLFLKYRFPVFISTKCTLIKRDIELLKQIDATAILPQDLVGRIDHRVLISVSISSMDEGVCNILEPATAKPLQRLELVRYLKEQGFLVGVNAMPVLPYISDTDAALEEIISAAKEYGADYILVGGLTLFGNQPADSKTLYYKFLQRYDASLITMYDQLYGGNFYPPKYYTIALQERVTNLCKKYNLRNSILK